MEKSRSIVCNAAYHSMRHFRGLDNLKEKPKTTTLASVVGSTMWCGLTFAPNKWPIPWCPRHTPSIGMLGGSSRSFAQTPKSEWEFPLAQSDYCAHCSLCHSLKQKKDT